MAEFGYNEGRHHDGSGPPGLGLTRLNAVAQRDGGFCHGHGCRIEVDIAPLQSDDFTPPKPASDGEQHRRAIFPGDFVEQRRGGVPTTQLLGRCRSRTKANTSESPETENCMSVASAPRIGRCGERPFRLEPSPSRNGRYRCLPAVNRAIGECLELPHTFAILARIDSGVWKADIEGGTINKEFCIAGIRPLAHLSCGYRSQRCVLYSRPYSLSRFRSGPSSPKK
jgi:hypothetical protein